MGRLLSTFTFDRNSVRKTASESSQAALKTLMLAKQGQIDRNDKTASNVAAALGSYLGILAKGDEDKYRPTTLGTAFEDLAAKNPVDAWQWLMSRSLWRFTIPNGTRSPINNEAKGVNATFCFFQTIVELLARLQGERGSARFLFYDELCQILVDDDNWSKETGELYLQIRENGWQKGLKTDRIDNDGNYEPGNIRFVTNKENCNNTRKNRTFNLNGTKLKWEEIEWMCRVTKNSFMHRIYRGWNTMDALILSPQAPNSLISRYRRKKWGRQLV